MFFDTHAHYDDGRFEEDMDEVINRAHESGVSLILNASSEIASCTKTLAICEKYDFMYGAVGVHPHYVQSMNNDIISAIARLASHPKVVAIGEIGLDYYYDHSPRDEQKYWFSRQINLAAELGMPIIVHNRDSHEDIMKVIKKENAKKMGGVFHCYSGSVEMAKELISSNFFISFGGTVTFKKAKKIKDVAEYVPIDRILIETDCPYLTPEPFRGKRNESSYVKYIAEKIAEIKGIELDEVADITSRNARQLFNIC